MSVPLFQPFRALGYITDSIPFSVQRLGRETFVTVSVGKSWQVCYALASTHLEDPAYESLMPAAVALSAMRVSDVHVSADLQLLPATIDPCRASGARHRTPAHLQNRTDISTSLQIAQDEQLVPALQA